MSFISVNEAVSHFARFYGESERSVRDFFAEKMGLCEPVTYYSYTTTASGAVDPNGCVAVFRPSARTFFKTSLKRLRLK